MYQSLKIVILLVCLNHARVQCLPAEFDNVIEVSTFWIRLPNLGYLAKSSNSDATGMNSEGSKIAGGLLARNQQFPHQAGLLINFPDGSGTLCGGSIISANFVLTAAHCLNGASDATVVVGTNTISIPSDAQAVEQEVTSKDMVIHPQYDPVDVLNDIAIVRLPKALTFSDKIQSIRLPSRKDAQADLTSAEATVSGWGALSGDEFAEVSDSFRMELRFVSNPVIANDACGKVFRGMIRESHVCVSGDNGKNACLGDSGGPLSVSLGANPTLIGIVSYGSTDGCEKGSPAVYTRVGFYLDWISDNTDIPIDN